MVKEKKKLLLNTELFNPTGSDPVYLHTTLPLCVGTTKLGLVEAVDALATIVLVVAAFAHSTPPRAVPKRPQSFPFHKTRRLLTFCYFLI